MKDRYTTYRIEMNGNKPEFSVAYVYKLLNYEKEVLYIGETTDIKQRLITHKKENRIPFYLVEYIELPLDNRQVLESILISMFDPPYNRIKPLVNVNRWYPPMRGSA